MRTQAEGQKIVRAKGRRCGTALAALAMLCVLQVSATSQNQLVQKQSPPGQAVQGRGLGGASLLQDGGTGIKVKSRKAVLFGNPKKSKTPAEVDVAKALKATPEARKIRDEGIPKGSAQYHILMSGARKRLSKVIRRTAIAEGRDCVVKQGSIRSNPHKLAVENLTDVIIERLEGVGGGGGDGGVGG